MNAYESVAQTALLRALSGLVLVACTALAVAQEGSKPEAEALEAEARTIVQQFVGRLKPRLKQAMGEGGPTHAIEVCAVEAPAIANTLSERSGWSVKRVSLKPRNSTMARADQWEAKQLRKFDRRQAAGEAAADISAAELINGEFRYMQAQGVEPLCLACHGENLAPAVKVALDEFYPQDKATGYRLGEIRGGISLVTKEN